MYREHNRWEKCPDRREPVTPAILKEYYEAAKLSTSDSYDAASFDWQVIGTHTGIRLCEWGQHLSELRRDGTYKRNVDNSSKAFVASDFTFFTKDRTPLRHDDPELQNKASIAYLCWRYQKNNQNGERVIYSKNIDNFSDCFIAAAIRICQRALRLQIPTDHPVAVFGNEDQNIQFFTDSLIETTLRKHASKVYKLTEKIDINRYGCHSMRVGACVRLHVGGARGTFIQKRLRWKSVTFLNYLRQVPQLAKMHNDILNIIS